MIETKVYWHDAQTVIPDDETPVDVAAEATGYKEWATMTLRYILEGRDYKIPLCIGGERAETAKWTGFFLPYVMGSKIKMMQLPGIAYWTDRIIFGKENRKLSDKDLESSMVWHTPEEAKPEYKAELLVVTRDGHGGYETRAAFYLPENTRMDVLDRERREVIYACTHEDGFFEIFRAPGGDHVHIHVPDVVYWGLRPVPDTNPSDTMIIG